MIKMPVSLRTRLALLNSLVLTGILITSFLLLYFGVKTWLLQQVDSSLETIGQQVALNVAFKNNKLISDYQVKVSELEKQRQFVRILNIHGQVQEHYGPLVELPTNISPNSTIPQKNKFMEISKPNDDEPIRVFNLPVTSQGETVGYIQTGESLESVENMLQVTFWALLFLIPLTLLVTLLGSRWITNKAIAPLAAIADTAEQISEHQLNRRLSIKGEDEVARLAASLDRMLDRLECAFESYRHFVGDVSHELRTPLTIMKGEISLALQRDRDNHYYVQALNCMDEEVDRLVRLLEHLLFLARVENNKIQIQNNQFYLAEILQPMLRQVALLADEKGQQLTWQIPEHACLETDRDIFQQVILNLLENAVKYTPKGGRIKLVVQQFSPDCTITISDTGKGIAKENLDRVFDRFYQADQEHSRGTGLGLAIVQKLVTVLGGQLQVASEEGQGTTFLIRMKNLNI